MYADEPPIGFDVVESDDVADGWEDAWRDFHHGVVVGRFWVGPPWEEPPAGTDPIVVDPGRAFGTGAHATTRLSLELLQALDPGSLLDIGCGSGVLSIAAARVGFDPVTAVDIDGVAVEVARANAQRNGVPLEAHRLDALREPVPPADVAVANVALDVVEALLPLLHSNIAVTSGYLERDRPDVAGWRPRDRRTRDGWAADLLERG